MTPFRNAVSFIYSDTSEFMLIIDCFEMLSKRFLKTEFGSYVEETGAGVTASKVFHDSSAGGGGCLGVDRRNIDLCSAKSGDLVLHESKQGGYDDCDAMIDDGRELVAKRFAKRSGGLDEDIVAVERGGDDFSLIWS
jgi:hypothetical protein